MSKELYSCAEQPLKVQFITDVHYYSRKCGTKGTAYKKAEAKSQKIIKDSDLVIKAGFDILCEDTSTDIVILSGDTTRDGEIDSHKEFIEMLRDLKKRGKRVYVITATHDFRAGGVTPGYDGDKEIQVPAATRDMLWDMYYEFGPNEAISYHRESMSYIVQLAPGYRLFALNDDTNGKGEGERGSGFSDDCMEWILEQLKDAQDNGQYVIAMTHHPMIAPSPFYAIIGKGDMQRNHETTREIFADAGLHCMLTGHTHIHDISVITSKKGNKFYDISCGAMIGCPPVMRNVVFDPKNKKITTDTITIKNVPGLDTGGVPFDEYMKTFFFGMITELVEAAATDIDHLAEMTGSFSVPGEKVKKIGWLIKPIAKWLNKLTIKKIWRVCKKESGATKAEIEKIGSRRVVDFILELVQNLYCGDSPYTPDTAEYRITCGVLNIVDSFLNTIGVKIGKILKGAQSVRSLVEPLLYNPGPCDAEAELEIFPIYSDENPAPEQKSEPKQDTVRKSKKGPALLAILVLLVVLLLALIIGIIVLIAFGIKAAVTSGVVLPFLFS